MSVTYRRLVGSTDKFAVEIAFVTDPDGGRQATAAEAASWGTLKLFVNGREPTSAIGPDDEALDGVTWYLLPLLEWLVKQWDPILHESRFPVPERGTAAADRIRSSWGWVGTHRQYRAEAAAEYANRHAIISAREGGIFPNVVFSRSGNDIEVSWNEGDRPGGGPVRFVQPVGVEFTAVEQFASVWHETLTLAVAELKSRCSDERVLRLDAELKRLPSPDETQRSKRSAWLLGLRSDLGEAVGVLNRLAAKGIRLPASLDMPLFQLATLPVALFASLAPNLSDRDLAAISGLFGALKPMGSTLQSLVRREPCPMRQAYVSGNQLALEVRDELGLDAAPVNMDAVFQMLDIPILEVELSSAASVRGLSLVSGLESLAAVNVAGPHANRPWARAAILAHELCHVLFDRNIGTGLAVASGPWAPLNIEQRANAFAAMFLMPADGVAKAIEGISDPEEQVKAVALKFGSSYRASIEQLSNLDCIDDATREELLARLDDTALGGA